MKEITFLKNNAERWKRYEAMLHHRQAADPDELASTFIQITDDLSFSRTFYPTSPTTTYLNQLAGSVHRKIYRNRKESFARIYTFWGNELPVAVKSSHRALLLSLFTFLLAISMGALSALNDDTFIRQILGDSYVDMTIENIRNGDPFAVYKSESQMNMFAGITLNNLFVSFRAYAFGLIAGLGTLLVLVFNGIMVGAFQGFFHTHGLLAESFLNVYIHGTLELSAIAIAGGAGFKLVSGLMFPGTYSRGKAFRNSARTSLMVIVGLIPIFILAGALESFVTRYSNMADWIKLTIILISAIIILWLFVIYPLIKTSNATTKD